MFSQVIYQLRLPGDCKFFKFKCSVNVTIKKKQLKFDGRVSLLCASANKKLSAIASITQKGMSAKAFFESQFPNFSFGYFTDKQVIITSICYMKKSLGWSVMT